MSEPMRILIVEDEIKIRVGIGKLITSLTKHEVIAEARNGREGLEMFLRYKPELVITDIRMPEMDGLEMLRAIRREGGRVHAVILSGYAEFEYARTAIELGVTDYLLKPIGVEDVTGLLEKIEKCIAQEVNDGSRGSVESCLGSLYMEEGEDVGALSEALQWKKGESGSAEKHNVIGLYLGYIGAAAADYRERFAESLQDIIGHFPGCSVYTVMIDRLREILCMGIFATEEEQKDFEQMFTRRILQGGNFRNGTAVWSCTKADDLVQLPDGMKHVRDYLSYADLVTPKELISERTVKEIAFEDFIYPGELEKNMKSAICSGKTELLEQGAEAFREYFRKHKFQPEYTVHGYLKLFSFLMNLLQEIDAASYEQLQNMCILSQISDARIRTEMENCLEDVIKFIINSQYKKEDIRNYTIKRAINYIREHYQESISLEGIAMRLEITPEYLSTLFNKEVGINFSAFLKEFRISHAKRLLAGTDLKIYEIAEKVGYGDPKYFMRVFKEVQGISPKEYRQNH